MSGRKYAYIRVSSKEENPARQKNALLKAGVEEDYIFTDKMSGKDFEYYYDQIYNKDNMTAVEAMEELNISKSTFYRRKSMFEKNI